MTPDLLARGTAEVYAEWFRALSDGTRVQLLALLASEGRPMSVGELTESLPVGQSTVSHHLAALVAVGFVAVRRHGSSSLYGVNPACVECFPTAADVVMGRYPIDPATVSCVPQEPTTDRPRRLSDDRGERHPRDRPAPLRRGGKSLRPSRP